MADSSFIQKLAHEHQACTTCPPPAEVVAYFKDLLGLLYKDHASKPLQSPEAIRAYLSMLQVRLDELLSCNEHNQALAKQQVGHAFFERLEWLYDKLNEDVEAIYKGDPAAQSPSEVIRSYPGFYAVAAYRLAHELHTLGVVDLPRIMTEHAHSMTGIDIHPGAQIGRHFCMDHGTGIVIGETAEIGDYVKLYQGVTLGALSVHKEDANVKRHPIIEDHVVIYAGATILGGQTVIGHHSVIGGNVWITRSIAPHSKIYYKDGQTITSAKAS